MVDDMVDVKGVTARRRGRRMGGKERRGRDEGEERDKAGKSNIGLARREDEDGMAGDTSRKVQGVRDTRGKAGEKREEAG